MAQRVGELCLLVLRRVCVNQAHAVLPVHKPKKDKPTREKTAIGEEVPPPKKVKTYRVAGVEESPPPTHVSEAKSVEVTEYKPKAVAVPESKHTLVQVYEPKPKAVSFSESKPVSVPEPKPILKPAPLTKYTSKPSTAPKPVIVAMSKAQLGCRPDEETEPLTGWKKMFFMYIRGPDGKRRRVTKLFHKDPNAKKSTGAEQFEAFRQRIFGPRRSCPRRFLTISFSAIPVLIP